MNGTDVLRVGFVGAGGNTRQRHIPGLAAIAGVRLVSVCNRSRESSERVAREFGIPVVYDRWQDLVAAADTDAIVIGTWPYLHAEVTCAALAAGKHVLCEARMAIDLAEARAMLAAAREHPDCVAQVVPAPFTLKVDDLVRRLLAEDAIGPVLAADLRALSGSYLDPGAPLTWRQDRALSGLNIMSLGIWYETLMRWVGEARRVYARGSVWQAERRRADTGEVATVTVPDHLLVSADLACGAQASMLISTAAGGAPETSLTLYGREGTLRFVADEGRLYVGRRGEKGLREVPPPAGAPGWRVEEDFVVSIRDGAPVTLTSFVAGVRYMAFTQAVADSLAADRPVDVPA